MQAHTLPPTLARTREHLHRVAEHVVSPARHAVTGRIGLRPAPGGFATPPFGEDARVVAVDEAELVVRSSGAERRAPLETLRAAAAFVGVEPGAPAHVYTPATPLELDEPLDVDPEAARLLADWYQLGAEALRRLAAEIPEDEPTEAQLWPEHFDLGISAGGVNYGASPGDEHIPDPYLYVSPHGGVPPPDQGVGGTSPHGQGVGGTFPHGQEVGGRPPGDEDFWNAPFGATRTIHEVRSADDAVAFFRAGRDRAARSTQTRRTS